MPSSIDLTPYLDKSSPVGTLVRYNHCPFCGHDVGRAGFIVTRKPRGYIMWCHRCHAKRYVGTSSVPSKQECLRIGGEAKNRILSNHQLRKCANPPTEITVSVQLPADCVPVIPTEAIQWLSKYRITPAEIVQYGFQYSHYRQRLILPVYDSTSGDLIYWQGRYFGTDATAPKYHNIKSKRTKVWFDTGGDFENVTILCEDILSAIAIHRSNGYRAIALLGCFVSDELITLLQSEGRQVIVWLDPDKRCEAVKYAKRLCVLGVPSRAVITATKDPKEYTPLEVYNFIHSKTMENSDA
jgi:hypothetical protein